MKVTRTLIVYNCTVTKEQRSSDVLVCERDDRWTCVDIVRIIQAETLRHAKPTSSKPIYKKNDNNIDNQNTRMG